MATKRLSPTANLLRHSRLFSLPPPLPRPSQDLSTTIGVFNSDTATLPYPTHASIETTRSSLSRGDWGLKRPLPQQSTTATTTPVIRIGAIDSIDHITDFNSAADHTLTLRKWQEMNIPINVPAQRVTVNNSAPPVSVFEENLDRTEQTKQESGIETKRWKYKGPWVAGYNAGEFEDYLKREVKRRRPEFRKFLKVKLEERRALATRHPLQKAQEISPPEGLSEERFTAELIKLRHEPGELYKWIWEFLDLPGTPNQQDAAEHKSDTWLRRDYSRDYAEDNEELNPPSTHPSAGLSYLRTASHVPNHPILGPMATQPPVLARVLKKAINRQHGAIFGVGGVIAKDAVPNQIHNPNDPHMAMLDRDAEGGPKGWVHPYRASIDPKGKIVLHIEKANKDTVAVWEKPIDDGYGPTLAERTTAKDPSRIPAYAKRPTFDPAKSASSLFEELLTPNQIPASSKAKASRDLKALIEEYKN
jgi:hypothetical protein